MNRKRRKPQILLKPSRSDFCGGLFAKIRRKIKKRTCLWISALGFAGAFLFWIFPSVLLDNFVNGFFTIFVVCYLIIGILFLAASLHDSDMDEVAAAKPPRFFTVNKDGDIILSEVSTSPPLDYTETRRADGKVDISMEIHSKEQAVEVLAALAIMYDKGDIAGADYSCTVHKIREHFNL